MKVYKCAKDSRPNQEREATTSESRTDHIDPEEHFGAAWAWERLTDGEKFLKL